MSKLIEISHSRANENGWFVMTVRQYVETGLDKRIDGMLAKNQVDRMARIDEDGEIVIMVRVTRFGRELIQPSRVWNWCENRSELEEATV